MSMQTTSLDRYEPSRATPTSSFSSNSYSRRHSKSSNIGITPLFAAATGTGYREQTHETSIEILLWYPNQLSASTSTLSKTPLLREVPQVKRKLTRKDRDPNNVVTETRSFSSLKSAAPSWLRERPSRTRLASQYSQLGQSRGAWKRATAICRDNGVLLLYGEDRALVHSIPAKDLQATDIRLVDDSLFCRPNVLGIFSRPSTFSVGARSPASGSARTSLPGKDKPIYLCFPSSRKLKQWRGLLRTFSKPEIYGSPQKGGTHRCYRQIDMTIFEAKLVADRPALATRSNSVMSPSPIGDDDDDRNDQAGTGLGIISASGRTSVDEALKDKPLSDVPEVASAFVSHLSEEGEAGEQVKATLSEDDEDSDREMVSGPISGIAGRERIMESSPMMSSGSGYEMERKGSDGQFNASLAACYCVVWMAGEPVAQTKVRSGPSNVMTWFDKFSLKDLPNLNAVQIEVMQSGRNGKFGVMGTVNLSMDTMRRGESIEGWFPIWSSRARDAEPIASPMETCYGDEMMGEIKISINVSDETILPLRKYKQVDEALHAGDEVGLMQALCKGLDEDRVVSHLVDIYTSKGTIVEWLGSLTEAESASFGENLGPALLFRSNTLLTRAVDKYQRLYCRDWLDACVGPTVRRICQDQIWLEANDSQHYYSNPFPVQEGSTSSSTSGLVVVESNLDALQRLCNDVWNNIYINRHRCPRDLRSALSNIRTMVNARFHQADNVPGPGIQGVGAFVFLRLICPAITTPNLYGLMGCAPNSASSKTLMLVAKVFLALANKRVGFDKDKEPWLVQANDFLVQQSDAYDDFITYVSTEPPKQEPQKESLGNEADYGYQKVIKERANGLLLLHRESLPSPNYMLDHALALASLVSYVVRAANVELYQDGQQQRDESFNRFDSFVDLCCDVEDQAGYYLDRAGYNPEPIDVSEGLQYEAKGTKLTQIYTAINPPLPLHPPLPSTDNTGSMQSMRARRATVSEGRTGADDEASYRKPVMSSIGEDSFLHHRLPLHFAPQGKALGARLSMESDEDTSAQSLQHLVDGSESTHEVKSAVSGGGALAASRGGSIEEGMLRGEISSLSEDHSSLPKVKRGWWKKG